MDILKIPVIIYLVYAAITLIFRYFITIQKIKPNKLSKLFYSDDESFIELWKKTRKKGMLRHILNTILISILIMSIIGIYFILNKHSLFGEVQGQTFFVALLHGLILGLVLGFVSWFAENARYRKLKEKRKVIT